MDSSAPGAVAVREKQLCAAVDRAAGLVSVDRADMLARLGRPCGTLDPNAAFFRLISRLADPAARNKLAAAWNVPRERRAEELIGLVDRLVDLRRQRARAAGFATPLEQTLTRSTLSMAEVASFVRDYLAHALAGHERLAAAVRAATDTTDEDPMNHVPYYMRRLTAGTPLPRLPAERWLAAASEVAARACDFRDLRAEPGMLTFDGARALFHRVGHRISAALTGTRLPLERREDLGEWFEKWVFHPDLGRRVAGTEEVARGLARCRRAKLVEFLGSHAQRAVAAALDLDVHGRTRGGLRESFRRLDEEFGVGRYCDLGDMAGYFTEPAAQANPGMYMVHLWGSAFGAERFTPFLDRRVADLAPAAVRTALASCFDPELPSLRPDIGAVSAFYERGLADAEV